MRKVLLLFLSVTVIGNAFSQTLEEAWYKVKPFDVSIFSHQDSLRGSIAPERAWWDLLYYDLHVEVEPEKKFISGTNLVRYKVLQEAETMQIDLQEPMEITNISQDKNDLKYTREGNVYFISLNKKQRKGEVMELVIKFSGHPREAVRAPWDGGFSWKKDSKGNPFVATSCQGLGASAWWPCKDHMYDEPDNGMDIIVSVPEKLTAVSNGRLIERSNDKNGLASYHWQVVNPISNYAVNVNIGDYVEFEEVYNGEKGPLDCKYYVLKDDLEKAKEQFKQVPLMLEAFEYWFGPYPFYEDGYKLVEVPYLGMEHQSSVTYGNGFRNGYLGRDISDSGWGLKFDFIIIHESGHEWFANSITYKDIADMWIHESFINYSESLYLEYHFGKKAGYEYVRGLRKNILNDIPIIGIYDVNHEGSGDMYYKGANMLHMIRQILDNDEKWRGVLRGLNEEFYHTVVTTKDIEDYMINYTGLNLQPVFDQYLRTTDIPTLEYFVRGDRLMYRWINVVGGFNMPVKIIMNGKEVLLKPGERWSSYKLKEEITGISIHPDFYVGSMLTVPMEED